MNNRSSGTAALGKSSFVDNFSISIGALFTTIVTAALKIFADVDVVIGVEI